MPYFELECIPKYKVNSLVAIITKPIVDKLKKMFEILDDIGIIHPKCDVTHSNQPLGNITILAKKTLCCLRLPFPPLIQKFFVK